MSCPATSKWWQRQPSDYWILQMEVAVTRRCITNLIQLKSISNNWWYHLCCDNHIRDEYLTHSVFNLWSLKWRLFGSFPSNLSHPATPNHPVHHSLTSSGGVPPVRWPDFQWHGPAFHICPIFSKDYENFPLFANALSSCLCIKVNPLCKYGVAGTYFVL